MPDTNIVTTNNERKGGFTMPTQSVPVIDTSKIDESMKYRLVVATAKAFKSFLEQPGAREYLDAKIAKMHTFLLFAYSHSYEAELHIDSKIPLITGVFYSTSLRLLSQ